MAKEDRKAPSKDASGAGVRWMVDGYQEWLDQEGVGVVQGLAIDLTSVETQPWPRMAADAVFVHLDARGDYCSMYVLDVPSGGSTSLQRHLYEAVVYVVDGRGAAVLERPGGGRREFEWGRGSLFALPLNMPYRLHNASGSERARLAFVTDLPLIMKLFRNQDFVFGTEADFSERITEEKYLVGEGKFIPVREHRHMWETFLIPDLLTFDQLRDSPGRGRGSTNIQFVLGDGTLHSHASDIPPGNYKKAHVHGDGYHITQLSGQGYSLYWNTEKDKTRVDWKYGLLHSPPRGTWHQHFNVSDEPARYMAAGFGSMRYPVLREKLDVINRSYAAGGAFQIEYEDEDPAIAALFEEERAKFRSTTADVSHQSR